MRRSAGFIALLVGYVACELAGSHRAYAAETPDPAGIEFFEKQVRPVLVDRCYSCHSEQSKKLKADLRLDTRMGTLRGGESGQPSVVPGNLDKSKLIEAVRYTNADMQMPPKEKLSAEQITALETWVKMGAPDPRTGGSAPVPASHLDVASAKTTWWSFIPVKPQTVPQVKGSARVQTPIDAFIIAALEAKGLALNRPADKRALIRRAYFDLVGLAPSVQEVEAFASDASPNAFATVVDRLLASPQYGERWARYWLDVARYADTKGYVFQEERRYPFAYTYRDWVIRALNCDMPYDQFLVRQIAADLLPAGEDKQDLAAMGFLTVGRRFLNSQPDIIDDRIDVVCRGTMGLTVACARCHDHKYDPIPTKDYYSLYGVFGSCTEPAELPMLTGGAKSAEQEQYEHDRAALQAMVDAYREKKVGEINTDLRTPKALNDYLSGAYQLRATPDGGLRAEAQRLGLRSHVLLRWRRPLTAKSNPVFLAWQRYAAIPPAEFTAKAPAVVAALGTQSNSVVVQAFTTKPPQSMQDVIATYATLLASVDKATALPDTNQEALRQVLYGNEGLANVPVTDSKLVFNKLEQEKERALSQKVEALAVTHPGSPARAMVMVDLPQPMQPRVFVRGNQGNQGDLVPRQAPAIVSPEKREPFKQGSGRLALANLIAGKENPLTARVMVNRVWLHHFGYGIVRTPSDFGRRGEPPSHPQLLDYLADRFTTEGWSLKKLHRQIMLSSVYQQSSDDNPTARAADPENRLLWRMNRQRLDFEATRDEVLQVAGRLDPTLFGKPVELTPAARRRTIYGSIDRQNLPSMFRAFDFASPDAHSPQRFYTTVPQQALFMMNSPFILDNARNLAARSEIAQSAEPSQKINRLYRLVFGRDATKQEITIGLDFVNASDAQPSSAGTAGTVAPATWQYGFGEFDAATSRLKAFQRFAHFTGTTYQGGPAMPDKAISFCSLTATGGHPGIDAHHAAVRRWTAPADGTVTVSGTLNHPSTQGDGVRARVVSSRLGSLGTWTAFHSQAATRVEAVAVTKGDTIDFIADCRESHEFDSFEWAPVIRITKGAEGLGNPRWSAKDDFSTTPAAPVKPMTVWEKYAQVLLECNEFVFVD